MKKRMLSFVLALALCLTLLPTALAAGNASFSGGSGTAEDPYQISTAEDMFALAEAVNQDKVSYEGSYFRLTKDIDLGNIHWTPIGNNASREGRQFLGSFDGGGYTISGLEVDVDSGYVGLFGVVGLSVRDSGAEVKNLRVEGKVSAARTSSFFYIGGIAGFVGLGANLTDCSFQGTVEASVTDTASAAHAGGIAGYNMGTISGCSVSDSSISGISLSSGVNYKILAAGIAAGNDAWNGGAGTIENCTVEDSTITSSASDTNTQSCAGGIVADNIMGSITQCNVTGGSVSTQGPMLVSSVGGIAGGSDGKVTDCTNSASVKGPDKNTADVAQGSGGILGWNKNLVAQCINTGSVSGDKYTGGIVGYNTTNGEDTGTIYNSYNTGAVMGDDYIGGIVGCNYNTVAQCGNTGSVTGSGNYIGGVAGYNNNYTNLFTLTFIGTIENTYNTGAVTGGDYIGGIVGQAEDGACAYSYNCGTISSGQAANIGGIFGHIDSPASAQNCYYLDTSAGSSAAVSGVESKTSEEFKSGEVAFLLNSGDPQQIWGQELGTDEAPILTDDADKSVVQVTFENSDATTTAQYANPGGTVDVPDITGTAPDGQVYGWFDADGNRYTDATSISADVTLTLALAYAVPAAGSGYTIDYAAETAAAAANYEISTDGQAWLDSGDGSIPIVPGRTLFVRYLGDGSVHISEPAENILASRPAAPDTVAGGRRQISGLTAAMEYQEPNSTVWVKITEDMLSNGVLPNLALGTYQVRYSAVTSGTAPAFASESLSVQVIQSSSGGGSSTPTYRPDVETTDNGTVTVTPRNPERGDKVTITPDPDTGYEVDDVTITDRNGDEVPVTDNGDGTWSFTQPTGKVTIEVTFREIPAEPEPLPFTDVPEDAWYSDAVRYVYENGLMAGTGAGAFSPNETTSRGMIATVLWRMAGSPQDNDQMAFSDVADGAWYAQAAHWAAGTGISSGYGGGLFGPDDPITREQLAVMLYQFARDQGYDLSIGQDTNILSYTDASEVSEYAVSALQWACGAGIISGTGDGSTLSPQGQATRAQTAVMLMRFCELDL